MKRIRGFTLVELLVVIAIISILAAIVVPNVARYIERARMTRALSEIKSIELAITKMLADADRGSVNDLFNPAAVQAAIGASPGQYWTADQWAAAERQYTRGIYGLLRDGRAAQGVNEFVVNDGTRDINLFNLAALQKMGTSYLDIGFDPWGQLYRIFPGPWSTRNGPTVFRTFLKPLQSGEDLPGRGVRPDALTIDDYVDLDADIDLDGDGNPDPMEVSFPSPRDKVAFIWSTGANLISGQAIYQPVDSSGVHPYTGTDVDFPSQEPELIGGGDDVNNWDSNRTWERFYN